ncbi:exo-beta-N-acetylmuramidase NamZ family protein [Desulforhopalus singaporensis]|uniref:Uncharacterized conserved protein YbbC, DUF1343 family n=1 Tax=Desulforhopalus singaporensis TaxID=91360 RepID=A0A1H0P2L1_9BACT|nr:DUF1343 domain-containing protein [Desulforhopalus singaporensis]SDO98968.1 Uncharacterized conserved protein YbbC, DUF1343 family [Desulforhopalus singaporensis]
MLQVGLERLLERGDDFLKGQKTGYLSNHASTDHRFVHGRVLLKKKYGDRLTCLFSPQHGFFAEKQDNMIESGHAVDAVTGLPIFSLYGEHRKPTPEMLAHLDVLLIDLMDVGTRVYTFMHTMAYCMQAAAELGKRVVILDRPNPIGGTKAEGNLLKPQWSSFVGLYPLPMRHGLTLGELALMLNKEYRIGVELDVVELEGWDRSRLFRDTGFPWLAPSPNMPTPETALVYPGQVIWEGTHISEARGTTQPFELVGAPYWNHEAIKDRLKQNELPGCVLRDVVFEPTSGKWAHQTCCGFQICVTDQENFMPYRTSLALFQAAFLAFPDKFEYKQPPYEYEYERLPMDLILGDGAVRKLLEQGKPVEQIEQTWQKELDEFEEMRAGYYLY